MVSASEAVVPLVEKSNETSNLGCEFCIYARTKNETQGWLYKRIRG